MLLALDMILASLLDFFDFFLILDHLRVLNYCLFSFLGGNEKISNPIIGFRATEDKVFLSREYWPASHPVTRELIGIMKNNGKPSSPPDPPDCVADEVVLVWCGLDGR